MAYFPPSPVYPKSYDSDYTLFLVYNTAETVTTEENMPWAEEIFIKPVESGKDEIWADNGYANIDGELFYYDSVGYDAYGKVNKLKRCSRNLGGTHTKHNRSGAEVRGFVVAEHHNQLVDAILNIENFVGENFTTDKTTLDWRIRNLQSLPVIFDDFTCPDVIFDFFIVSDDPATGIVAQYAITIDGTFTSYRLDFGDGEFTTTSTRGTHRYAPNASIDPVITVTNSKCTSVQTPITRTLAAEPTAVSPETNFEIKIPTLPNIPTFTIPTIPIPSNIVQPPPIVFPCVDIGGTNIGPINIPSIIVVEPPINIPSVINITGGISIPSTIDISPVSFPSQIMLVGSLPSIINFGPVTIPTLINFGPVTIPTLISFVGTIDIPTMITFGSLPTIPSFIDFGDAPIIPTLIEFGDAPFVPTLIEFGDAPIIPTLIEFGPAPIVPTYITFGPAPDITTHITFGDAPDIPTMISFGSVPDIPSIINFGSLPTIPSEINFGDLPNIPSEINFGDLPSIPSEINFGECCDIPSVIDFGSAPSIPSVINFGECCDIPSVITFGGVPDIPTLIEFGDAPDFPTLIEFGTPPTITVDWGSPPTLSCTISVDCPSPAFRAGSSIAGGLQDFSEPEEPSLEVQMADLGIPSEISVKMPEIPDIRVLHDIPEVIRVEMPNIPDIKIIGPAIPLPREINIMMPEAIPSFIILKAVDLPTAITLDASNIPSSIKVEMPDVFPSIKIDASGIPDKIQVVGIPSTIELVGAPSEIKLVMPDKPEVELVYKGAPIDVKINLDISRLTGEDGNAQCVAIVPCTPK